ncbi:MAG: circularly permuted type 2 ATP-grasp protein [Polyangiales bacterium]
MMPAELEQIAGLAGDTTLLDGYSPLPRTYDELFRGDGTPREEVADLVAELDQLGRLEFMTRQKLAESALFRGGVTFSVYSDSRGQEKIFPFDLIPRVIAARTWEAIERGLIQRVTALNLFLTDLYDEQRIIKEGRIPEAVVFGTAGYMKELHGIRPREGVFVNIAGIDLIRGSNGEFLVLEDNLRTPSGVSYVLENRSVMKRIFPGVFRRSRVRTVESYPARLGDALMGVSPRSPEESRIVVLTPGPYNSAYFEHSFLARQMGCDLVQGSDLFVHDRHVYVKTTTGPQPVDVIYRRIDDDYLDPTVFREDSALGVPGLIGAYAAGNVSLANAPGNGVADNKAIYPFVPDMIRFYLSEEPVLGQVETYLCVRPAECQHVLENLKSMVVKTVDGCGGYGMLFGPRASRAEIEEFASKIRANPEEYIAQPVIELSTCPTWAEGEAAPRRVDLRPFVLTGQQSWVLPGGLTRVALREGSYVVNSSQGGGSKDTWVLEGSAS